MWSPRRLLKRVQPPRTDPFIAAAFPETHQQLAGPDLLCVTSAAAEYVAGTRTFLATIASLVGRSLAVLLFALVANVLVRA